MRLIVNADDFGYSPGQNYGIIDAYENGIVRSTSLMAAGTAAAQAVEMAKLHPGLGVGVHLVIDWGRPVTPPHLLPSLTDFDGMFIKVPFEAPLTVNLTEVELEWRAQIECIQGQGILLTHLDGHHHFHLHPQLCQLTCKLAGEYQLPIRIPSPAWTTDMSFPRTMHPDVCLTDFYDAGATETYFTEFFTTHPDLHNQTVEVMCHPAYVDIYILSHSKYNIARARELQILKSSPVWEWVQNNGVELISYAAI